MQKQFLPRTTLVSRRWLRAGFRSYYQTVIACLVYSFSFTLNASTATLVNDAQLKAKPSSSSSSVKTLKKNASVSILKRQRGWYQVSTDDKTNGWLTLLQVRYERAPNASTPSDLSRFIGLRRGHSNVTATTGVRGIGEKDIKNSRADFNALVITKKFKSTPQNAKKFAQKAGLKSQSIAYPKRKGD